MKIAFNPSTVAALITPPNNKDITFDLRGQNIFARGVKFCGTDTNTWRDIKINNVSIGSNILDLRNGSNTTLTNTNGVVTINSTWRPVVDNLTSDSTTSSLSANQGRILKALIDGKSNSDHNHDDRYYTKAESDAKYITDITTSVNKLTFTKNGSNIIRDITVNVVYSQGNLTNISNKDNTTKASSGLYIYNSYSQAIGTNNYSSVLSINTGGTIQIAGNWGDNDPRNLYWRSQSDRNVADYPWKSWRTILDSENYSSTLDSRYYTESEVNSLLDAKLNRQNLSYGTWNPRGYHLAADYSYNGGDLSISESGGQIHVSVDGYFWQNEGQYRVLDTSDVAGLKNDLTVHQYLSNTDTTWWPLIWGGSTHNNTSDSTGSVYKSHDVLSWQTSSQTLYATNIQTNNIKNLSIGGGIYWNPNVESASDGSDAASITLVRSGVAGGTTLVLSQMNDANDTIQFQTNSSARLYHNSYPILTTQNTYVSNNKGYINNTEITQVNNADTVDYYHADSLFRDLGWWGKSETHDANDITGNGAVFAYKHHSNVPTWGVLVTFKGGIDEYRWQMAKSYVNRYLYIRQRNGDNNTWSDWVRLLDESDLTWNNITGKPSSYIPSAHTHNWTSITDKLVAENEFNIVNAGFNGDMYFNYLPINDRGSTATVLNYYFGNGHKGLALVQASGFVKVGSSSSYVLLGDGGHKLEGALNVANADTVDGEHASNFSYTHQSSFDFNTIKNGRIVTFDQSGTDYNWINGFASTHNNYLTSVIFNTHRTSNWYVGYMEGNFSTGKTDGLQAVHKLAFVDQIPTSLKNPYSLTLKANGTTLAVYDGSSAKEANFTYTNVGAASASHNHDGRYVRAFGTSNDNIDSDWGQSFKTFDPIPSGTPPEQNPNISILNIGENFDRRKQLAFIWNNDNIYYRRHTESGFTGWKRLALTSDIPTVTNYYWANVKISASSSTTTSPTVHTLTATRVCAGHNPEIDNSISCSNWFRSSGNTGWYNTTYMGGWYMSDTSWIRAYNGVGIYTSGQIYSSSSIRMSNIILEHTDEINNSTDGGIHLNYRNSGNVSLCYGGGSVGIGTPTPSYKLDVNGQMGASGFHHSSVNSDNYILLAGGGYKSFGGDDSTPIFLGYLNLDHGNDGTISSSFYCLGYSVPFTYTRGGNYCRISIPDTTRLSFYINAAIASVNYSGGGMDTWVGQHRGAGAWWLHCYASGWNEVRVKGFRQANDHNDSWWGGNPLFSNNDGANRITVCIFGHVRYK